MYGVTEKEWLESRGISVDTGQDQLSGKEDKLEKLANHKVKTKDDVRVLLNLYGTSLQSYPRGLVNGVYDKWRKIQDTIITFGDFPKPHNKKIVRMFQAMKNFAVANKYNDLADAVTESASWYYFNIEKPSEPKSSLSNYGIDKSDPIAQKKEKQAKKSKIITWGLLGTSIVIGGTMLYFAFRSPKDNPEPQRKKRLPNKSKTVTKGRVRKRNRKGSYLQNKSVKPVFSSGNHLKAYRNKFERQKKAQSKSKGLRLK